MTSRSWFSATQVQIMVTTTSRNISMKQLLRTPTASAATPNMMGMTKPFAPPIRPTVPPTTPICPDMIEPVTIDAGLAKNLRHTNHEHQGRKQHDA